MKFYLFVYSASDIVSGLPKYQGGQCKCNVIQSTTEHQRRNECLRGANRHSRCHVP